MNSASSTKHCRSQVELAINPAEVHYLSALLCEIDSRAPLKTPPIKGKGECADLVNQERRAKLIEFYIMMDNFTPITLQNWYHKMDISAMLQHQPARGLIHASVFLKRNKLIHMSKMKKSVSNIITCGVSGLTNDEMGAFCTDKNGYPETDQAVNEFIYCHWVLLQLPFEPAMLHQWLAILLVRVFEIHLKVVLVSPLEAYRQKVGQLLILAKNLAYDVQFCFRWLQNEMEKSQQGDQNFDKININNQPDPNLIKKISNILATFEVFDAPKLKDWMTQAPSHHNEFAFVSKELKNREYSICALEQCWVNFCNMYMPEFWFRDDLDWIFAPANGKTKIERGPIPFELQLQTNKVDQAELRDYLGMFFKADCDCEDPRISDEKKLVEELLLEVSEDEITYWYKKESFYKVLIQLCEHHDLGKRKVYWKIVTAYSCMQVLLSKQHVMKFILNSYKKLPRLMRAPDDRSTCTLESIAKGITETEISTVLINKKKWHFEAILERAKMECLSADLKLNRKIRRNKELPNFMKAEVRIKKIVLKMMESQFTPNEQKKDFYPQQQYLHYILPSLMIHIWDVCQDYGCKKEERANILQFFDRLIAKFERAPVNLKLSQIPCGALNISISQAECAYAIILNNNYYLNEGLKNALDVASIYDFFFHLRQDIEHEASVLWKGCLFSLKMAFIESLYTGSINWNLRSLFLLASECYNPRSIVTYSNCNGSVALNEKEKIQRKIFWLQCMIYSFVQQSADHMNKIQIDRAAGLKYWHPLFEAFWCLLTGDRWKLKQLFSGWLNGPDREDVTSVTFKTAVSNPKIYGDLAKRFVPPDGKLEMRHPGEITFFPIKHCRWCGKVNCKKFRVCRECKEQEDYPDLNVFCSEKCENEAMEEVHSEEHARRLIELMKI